MKQKLIMTIIIAAAVSAFFSIIIAKFIFGSPSTGQQQVDLVPLISSNFATPSSQDFNSTSIDPTQLVRIGTSVNPVPFNNSTSQQ